MNFTKLGEASGGIIVTVKLADVIKAYTDGTISDYENNRGLVGIGKGRFKEIGSVFNTASWGLVTICWFEDRQQYLLVDGHTRMGSLMYFAKNNTSLSGDLLNRDLAFQLCPREEFFTRYAEVNNNKSHASAAVITNEDLPLGKLLAELSDDPEIRRQFPNQLANIAYTYFKNQEMSWDDSGAETYLRVLGASAGVNKISKSRSLEEVIRLGSSQKIHLQEAINIVKKIRDDIEYELVNLEIASSRGKNIKRMLKHAGIFGAMVTAAMCEPGTIQPIFKGKDPEVFVEAFINNCGNLDYDNLGRRGPETRVEYLKFAETLFGRY